jgi:hypothetical protein
MPNAVYCIAENRAQAETIVDGLKNAGFASSEISVLMADKETTREFAEDQDTTVPESAATGAGAGVGFGAVMGWLAGIGTLAIPGAGPFIAAGPIMAAIGGAMAGGALGGIIGALVGMGIPEEHAKEVDSRIQTGGVLVSVHTESPEQILAAKEIFRRAGAQNINSTGATVAA